LTPNGDPVDVPVSDFSQQTSFMLVDGSQFVSPASRWKIEFDEDHAISKSMKPPPGPPRISTLAPAGPNGPFIPVELPKTQITWTEDSGFVGEDDNNAEAMPMKPLNEAAEETRSMIEPLRPEEEREDDTESATASYSVQFSNSQRRSTPVGERSTASNTFRSTSPARADSVDPFNVSTPAVHHEECNELGSSPATASELVRRKITTAKGIDAGGKKPLHHVISALNSKAFARKSGEESQILLPQQKQTVSTRKLSDKSQEILVGHAVAVKTSQPKTQVQQHLFTETTQVLRSRSREASQVLQSVSIASERENFNCRDQAMDSGNEGVVHRLSTPRPPVSRRPSTVHGQVPRSEATTPLQIKKHSTTPRLLKTEDAAETITVDVPESHVRVSSAPSNETTTQDTPGTQPRSKRVSTKSTSGRSAKRRRSLESAPLIIPLPIQPAIVFSAGCTIQAKKKTIETFLQLGGKIVQNIVDADVFCTTLPLRKTSKFILAIALGKAVVTEEWIVECHRRKAFSNPGSFIPNDMVREQEWKFSLEDAVRRGQEADSGLSKLCERWNIYMTPQLQQKLGDLKQDFQQIASALGATRIHMRLPASHAAERRSSRILVLGHDDDCDAVSVGRLGYGLYEKGVLTMAALRGRLDVNTDEFKLEIPIKQES